MTHKDTFVKFGVYQMLDAIDYDNRNCFVAIVVTLSHRNTFGMLPSLFDLMDHAHTPSRERMDS